MIVGMAMGSWTLNNVCLGVDPNMSDASTDWGGTPWIPRVVSLTAGGNE
jgi:hypothetical protein